MDANNIQFTKLEILIVKYLFKHYKDRFNSRQLAKVLDRNHAHANKLCNALVKKLLLKKESMGNSVYFSFDYYNERAINFIEYLINLEETEFPKWLSVIVHSLKKFEDKITIGMLFGSSVKNNNFKDIDVLLVYKKDKAREINKIKDAIRTSQLIEQPIRYVDVEEKDIFLNKEDKIFYNILSNNLVFHGSEKYVEVIKRCLK